MSEPSVDISKDDAGQTKNLLNDSTYVIWYGVNHLSHIVIPVGLTMLFSTLLVNLIRPSGITDALEEGMTVYMVYKEEADNNWDAFWQALINAFVIVCVMGLITFVMVLYGLLYLSTFAAIGYTGWFVFYMAVVQYHISWDLISSIFIFLNFGVVSVICIFGTYAPDIMKKCFLVIISCLVCYLLSFFPDWTTWVLLVAMALYDMCAVLTPCGPLRLLLNLSKDRDDDIPGLLYETTLDRSDDPFVDIDEEDAIMEAVAQSTMEEDQKHIEEVMKEESEKKEEEKKEGEVKKESEVKEESEVKKPKEGEEKEGEVKEGEVKKLKEGEEVKVNEPTPETIMEDEEDMKVNRIFERESVSLGLGDFIFYSLMVSKASLSSSVPFVIVFIIILSGLLITMALLSILEMPLPALPFSMILGVTAYALAYFVMTSMMNQFALSGIMF